MDTCNECCEPVPWLPWTVGNYVYLFIYLCLLLLLSMYAAWNIKTRSNPNKTFTNLLELQNAIVMASYPTSPDHHDKFKKEDATNVDNTTSTDHHDRIIYSDSVLVTPRFEAQLTRLETEKNMIEDPNKTISKTVSYFVYIRFCVL